MKLTKAPWGWFETNAERPDEESFGFNDEGVNHNIHCAIWEDTIATTDYRAIHHPKNKDKKE